MFFSIYQGSQIFLCFPLDLLPGGFLHYNVFRVVDLAKAPGLNRSQEVKTSPPPGLVKVLKVVIL